MLLTAHLFLLPTLPLTLALIAPIPRHPPTTPHLHAPSDCAPTTTITKTVTVTIPIYAPTGNISVTFPNTTVAATSTSTGGGLEPITLITLSSVTSEGGEVTATATATGGGLEPVTLITLPSVTATATATAGGKGGDAGATPTPNDIAPVTLIDISTAVPI